MNTNPLSGPLAGMTEAFLQKQKDEKQKFDMALEEVKRTLPAHLVERWLATGQESILINEAKNLLKRRAEQEPK